MSILLGKGCLPHSVVVPMKVVAIPLANLKWNRAKATTRMRTASSRNGIMDRPRLISRQSNRDANRHGLRFGVASAGAHH